MPAVVDLAAMRDAMTALGGDPNKINPLVPVDLVIDHSVVVDYFGTGEVARAERHARIRAEPGALPLPEVGPAGLLQFLGRAARHRHLPSGQSRISRPDGVDVEGEARRQDGRGRLSRYAGRHRQPHHHGQRPRRARLGRRRHRGGGGDARPAALDAAARGDRLQAARRIARGRHRDRSRADRHPDAAQEGRGRQVRRVLRPRPQRDVGRRPRDDRQHGARIRRDLRPLPDRRADARLSQDAPGASRRASRSSRPTPRRRAPIARGSTPDPVFTDTLELDLGEVAPSLAGPKRPQDRVVLADAKAGFAQRDDERVQAGRRALANATRSRGRITISATATS